uniref:Uncharacterized protein n=1 Tax=Arundo donax TaxID=35708 RepID=A0A0A9FCL9_ARUDO
MLYCSGHSSSIRWSLISQLVCLSTCLLMVVSITMRCLLFSVAGYCFFSISLSNGYEILRS